MSQNPLTAVVRADIQAMHAYAVMPSAGLIKLDAMENPYPLPSEQQQSLAQHLAKVALHRYPIPSYDSLTSQLRQTFGVPQNSALILGNGSDELISLLCQLVASTSGSRAVVMAPEPSFVMYQVSAQIAGCEYVGVPLKSDFALDRLAFLAAITKHRPSLIFLAYPNNPTGNLFEEVDLLAIIAAAPESIVVIDEAYSAFAERSFMDRVGNYSNVLLLRTLSKMGLAGLRLGYAVADPWLIAQLQKIRPPYNINVLTEAAAEWALMHADIFALQAKDIMTERTKTLATLSSFGVFEVFPSQANFVLIRCLKGARFALELMEYLQTHGVLIKKFPANSVLADCLRITIGTPQEMLITHGLIQNFIHSNLAE